MNTWETPKADFSQVFRRRVNLPSGGHQWVEIAFDTPFAYNGVDNLVIAVMENTQATQGATAAAFSESAASGRARRARSDSTGPFNPMISMPTANEAMVNNFANIRFLFTERDDTPIFDITPDEKNFGTVNANQHPTQRFIISNDGGGEFLVEDVKIIGAGRFHFIMSEIEEDFPITIDWANQLILDVRFMPIYDGPKVATLEITYSIDGNEEIFNVPLTGVALDIPTTPIIAVTPNPEHFGTVLLNDTSARNFRIANEGIGSLEIVSMEITGYDAEHFGIISGNEPHSIFMGDNVTVRVRFAPLSRGLKNAKLAITYDNGSVDVFEVNLTGNGNDPRINEFPHHEPFASHGPPPFWSRMRGVLREGDMELNIIDPNEGWDIYAGHRGWTDSGTHGFANRLDIYGHGVRLQYWGATSGPNRTIDGWFVSPEIVIAEAGTLNLTFDIALTDRIVWAQPIPPAPPSTIPSDVFAVVVSYDNGATWSYENVVFRLDNTTNPILGRVPITPSQQEVNINVTPGSIRVAFYAARVEEVTSPTCEIHLRNIRMDFTTESALNVVFSDFATSFTNDNNVVINWETSSESNLSGFHLLRGNSSDVGASVPITQVLIPATNTTNTIRYSFEDRNAVAGADNYYWLLVMSSFGGMTHHGPIVVAVPEEIEDVPTPILTTDVRNVFPNPVRVNDVANFETSVKEGEIATLRIFNVRGQLVREFSNITAGNRTIPWNMRDQYNREVASGLYFYRLESPTSFHVRRLLVLR
jgi:hypothetical protein